MGMDDSGLPLGVGGGGGDYLREAINRGTAIIRGNMVFIRLTALGAY